MVSQQDSTTPTPSNSHTDCVSLCIYWAGIFKPLWSPGIDAKASIPPAYVAWRAGTITLFLLGGLAPIDFLKIPALYFETGKGRR